MIDLEPLLAATPALAAEDPRLQEQVLSWCAGHADRVNTVRLAALVRSLRPSARTAFETFGATVNALAGTKWPAAASPPTPPPRLREVPLPLDRPALLRLRARALCGVGTRADVLCDLLERPACWMMASELAAGGHSKRNVARVLAELDEAGLVLHQATGNVLRFRLTAPDALVRLLGPCPDGSPDRVRVFEFACLLLDLAALEELPPAVRRVEANTLRDVLRPLAERLSLAGLPKTRGEPKAWEALVDWATVEMAALARGDSAALRGGAS